MTQQKVTGDDGVAQSGRFQGAAGARIGPYPKRNVDLPVNFHFELGEHSKVAMDSRKLEATWELRPI